MNVESSRSHLIVCIMVESRNLTNGSVSTGKLSLVDLAGSERAAKTGAKDHQLKVGSYVMFWLALQVIETMTESIRYSSRPLQEANSINKSLSALGDVISALSAELPHVPYRNSKLTQVMIKKKQYTFDFEWIQTDKNHKNCSNEQRAAYAWSWNVMWPFVPLRWCRTPWVETPKPSWSSTSRLQNATSMRR